MRNSHPKGLVTSRTVCSKLARDPVFPGVHRYIKADFWSQRFEVRVNLGSVHRHPDLKLEWDLLNPTGQIRIWRCSCEGKHVKIFTEGSRSPNPAWEFPWEGCWVWGLVKPS